MSYFNRIMRHSVLGIIFFSNITFAQICQPPVVDQNTYNLTGIGDGCTIKADYEGITFNAAWIPNIFYFKDTFTASCNRHDKCLTQIGNTNGNCNDEFYSNMKNACNSKYKWYQPVERQICNETASMYFSAVQLAQSKKMTDGLQRASVKASVKLGYEVTSETCGTTPERSQLYSDSLISEVNNAYYMIAGRAPTAYEFFNTVNSTSYIDYPDQWRSNLNYYASYARNFTPPSVGITAESNLGLSLKANSVQGASYLWKVNGKNITEQTAVIYSSEPMYNLRIGVQGFIRVHSNGSRNMMIIDNYYTLIGGCAPTRGMACY